MREIPPVANGFITGVRALAGAASTTQATTASTTRHNKRMCIRRPPPSEGARSVPGRHARRPRRRAGRAPGWRGEEVGEAGVVAQADAGGEGVGERQAAAARAGLDPRAEAVVAAAVAALAVFRGRPGPRGVAA